MRSVYHSHKLIPIIIAITLVCCGCLAPSPGISSSDPPKNTPIQNTQGTTEATTAVTKNSSKDDISTEAQLQHELEMRNEQLGSEQIFYGTWVIKEFVPTHYSTPSRYSGFDMDGNFRGPDYDELIGQTICFSKDGVEYSGQHHDYAFGPVSYSFPLPFLPGKDPADYYDSERLELVGNYYTAVYFYLPDHYFISEPTPNRENKVYFSDFEALYLKDENTMYISEGVLLFLLERVVVD